MKLKIFLAFFVLFLTLPQKATATLIQKDINNKINFKVLGTNSFDLESAANTVGNLISDVSVKFENNNLVFSINKSENDIDLEEFEGDFLEVERENESERVIIAARENNFYIKQRGVLAATSYKINIDNKSDALVLSTETGDRYVSVFPYEAVEPLLKTDILDDINTKGEIELTELEEGELVYLVKGTKKHNIFDLFYMPADVTVEVSANTGKVLTIDAPSWSRILSILSV